VRQRGHLDEPAISAITMNANQLREQLLSFTNTPVAVPGHTGLFVRIPGYRDSLRIEAMVAKHSEGLSPEEKSQLHTGFMLAHCLCDEAGVRVFRPRTEQETEMDAANDATSAFAPLAFSLIEFIVETISERKRQLGKVSPPAQQPSG